MKKIITGIALGTVLLSNSAFANSAEEEMKLYKAVTLSRAKIERDFYNWANYNRVINDYFNRLRINKDKRKSEELDSRLKKAMAEYSGKSYLTAEDDRIYNLILNIYYRNILLKDYFLKDYNSNSNNNDIRVIIDKDRDNNRNNNSNNRTDYNRNGSLAYNYRVPSGWHQERIANGEMKLLRGYDYDTQDSVHFLITDYNKYYRFSDFFDAYKDELTRDNNVRNLRSTSTTLDWKTAYRINYDNYNWDEKTVYLAEYNGMVLIINATKKYRSSYSSNNDINDIINSIEIAKDSSSLRNRSNNNNSNNNSNRNSSISDLINRVNQNWNNNSNNRTDYNRNGSLAYNYRVLSGWHQERVRDGEMRLLRGYNSETQDSIHFLITDYNRYSRFSDFADAYKDELLRDNWVRNLRSTSTTLDWKTAYRISYDTYDSDEKTVYLVEYNGMVLIVNATKKYKSPSSSNNDITQIIDSIRIARDSNSLRDYNNNNNSNNNNNNNNNYNRNGSLSYNFKYPNGWNQEKWSSVTTLYRNNNNQDYVRFTIRDYNRFSNFNDFFEDYKNDVLRNSWIRNFRSSSTYIDGKSGYRIEYEDYNSDERTIYLIEYNGMVLVVEINKRNKNSSVDNDVNEIINSVRISN